MLFWSKRFDGRNERRQHISGTAILSGVSLIAKSLLPSPTLSLPAISVAAACIFAANAVLQTLPTEFLAGGWAAIAVAMINSIGNLGGFTSRCLVGRWAFNGSFSPTVIALDLFSAAGGLPILMEPTIVRKFRTPNFE